MWELDTHVSAARLEMHTCIGGCAGCWVPRACAAFSARALVHLRQSKLVGCVVEGGGRLTIPFCHGLSSKERHA